MFNKFNFNLNINGIKETVAGSTKAKAKAAANNTKNFSSATYGKAYRVVLKAINIIFCSKEEVKSLGLEEVESRLKTLKRAETVIKDISGLSTAFGIFNNVSNAAKGKKKVPAVSGPLTNVVVNTINIYAAGRRDASAVVALATPLVLKKLKRNIDILNARKKELLKEKRSNKQQPKIRRVKDFSELL